MLRYMCDFETTTDPDDCRVWAFAATDIDTVYTHENTVYGKDIAEFIDWCSKLGEAKLWFHNLKFDGEFIYSYLLNHGWEWVDDIRYSEPKTFSTLISDKGLHYNINMRFNAYDVVKVYDSLKVLPMPVSKIPAAFGLDDAKLDLDYKGKREVGHELTEHERDYIREDVVIVAKALKTLLDQGDTKMTAGSNSLAAYKRTVGGEKRFRKMFPVIECDPDVRLSYKGGWTYADPRFRGSGRRLRYLVRRELAVPVSHEVRASTLRGA